MQINTQRSKKSHCGYPINYVLSKIASWNQDNMFTVTT